MSLEMHQDMRLEQRQIPSQQLIQNMQLLQVPIQQLNELIMAEIEQNPALEIKTETDDSADEDAAETTEPEADVEIDNILSEIESERDFASLVRSTVSSTSLDDERHDFINTLSADSVSLQHHLLAQLADTDVSEAVRPVMDLLINSVCERGYLRISPYDAAAVLSPAYTDLDYDDLLELVKGDFDRYCVEAIMCILEPRFPDAPPDALVERVKTDVKRYTCEALAAMFAQSLPDKTHEQRVRLVGEGIRVLQGFDPPGVGAMDERECFLLQLDDNHADYARQKYLVEHHLDDIKNNRIPKIAKDTLESPQAQLVFGWTAATDPNKVIEEIKYTVEDLTRLNPSPGRTFSGANAAGITPDIIVKEVDGELVIVLEESYLPPVTISDSVVDLARKGSGLTEEERDFLRKKVDAARRIIQAIEQRRNTLTWITRRLMEKQVEFFEKGLEALKPLTMTELADELGVHITTVTRAVKGKYLQTPRGVYSMRFFFAASAPSPSASFGGNDAAPEEHTCEFVIGKIREIVDKESKKEPLSDNQIVDRLDAQFNVKLKRRTVAKYREEAGILKSRFRKQF